ncbi:MAG: hypothetical protein VX884_02450 [Pseudomonadota bacterium]|nr:hypothetical protein [Pseudomonadota bacterium]
MATEWNYQIRLTLTAEAAKKIREVPSDIEFSELNAVLATHEATLKCQFDAFSDYVSEAEREGQENYALYQWTKDTIENPEKKSKYLRSFTVYVLGDQIYSAALAEPLEQDLRSLEQSEFVLEVSKYDTNPAKNPQMPAKYRTEPSTR